jgi:hypothetical protein
MYSIKWNALTESTRPLTDALMLGCIATDDIAHIAVNYSGEFMPSRSTSCLRADIIKFR